MDLVVLDTDVFSMFFRRDPRSLRYDDDVRGKIRCLVFASVAELRFGAIVAGWGQRRRQQLEDAIARAVVLPADDSVTLLWAQVKADRQHIGRPISSEDCWVAATALRHDLPLLRHNAADYHAITGLKLITHPDAKMSS
jgi:tRNA(fMet)-specific endonuclease VapC